MMKVKGVFAPDKSLCHHSNSNKIKLKVKSPGLYAKHSCAIPQPPERRQREEAEKPHGRSLGGSLNIL